MTADHQDDGECEIACGLDEIGNLLVVQIGYRCQHVLTCVVLLVTHASRCSNSDLVKGK
uniref:Uncharacterized protein n=1 Tax=Hyaloperonospora arabidopsidis (strain Emoy2) TaxID=559515 RepID=M4B8I3_HYAAE